MAEKWQSAIATVVQASPGPLTEYSVNCPGGLTDSPSREHHGKAPTWRTGIGVLAQSGTDRTLRGFFVPVGLSYDRTGRGGSNARCCSDSTPTAFGPVPHWRGAAGTSTRPEQTIMNTTIIHADGTTTTAVQVQFSTVVRRIRRKLQTRGHRFIITRPNTPDRLELGRYAVRDADGAILQQNADLEALARYLGALADHEQLGPIPCPLNTGVTRWEIERHQRRQEAKRAIQEAINQNPTLSHMQSAQGDPVLWQRAVGIDMALQQDPAWSDYAERFREVVRILEAEHGPICVPKSEGDGTAKRG